MRLFEGLPYGPEHVDPATAPLLLDVQLSEGRAADAFTDEGLIELGLPATYSDGGDGGPVPRATCQPIGRGIYDAGHDGVDARSAARGGVRELAWYPRDETAEEAARLVTRLRRVVVRTRRRPRRHF